MSNSDSDEPFVPTPEELEARQRERGSRQRPANVSKSAKAPKGLLSIFKVRRSAITNRTETEAPETSLTRTERGPAPSPATDDLEARLPEAPVGLPDSLPPVPFEDGPLAVDPKLGREQRVRSIGFEKVKTATPTSPVRKVALNTPEGIRFKAEQLGHDLGEWMTIPGDDMRLRARCRECKEVAEIVYQREENYTEAQAVMRDIGDATRVTCRPAGSTAG
jgi:hypothetical protein